jgi:hypothetical protein
MLPVIMYGCGHLSAVLREEHKTGISMSRAPRRVFGPKRDVVMGGWRKSS